MLALSAGEIFSRMCERQEFYLSEMSMGAHLNLLGTGDSPFVGLPAFPSRAFRHAMLYANVDAGIEGPGDLNGKRIAIREWGMTAVLRIIGILTDEHGLDIASVDWVAAAAPRVSIAPPAGVRMRLMAPGEDLSDLLETGTLAAMVPFLAHAMDDTRALFGEDWWPYGVEANRACLERMIRYAFAQGLTPRVLDVEELFAAAVHG